LKKVRRLHGVDGELKSAPSQAPTKSDPFDQSVVETAVEEEGEDGSIEGDVLALSVSSGEPTAPVGRIHVLWAISTLRLAISAASACPLRC
jgi:hypothetical protein